MSALHVAARDTGESIPAEPQFWSFREGNPSRDDLRAAVLRMREEGATWFRCTQADGGIWIEGWLTRPKKEAPFNPPRVIATDRSTVNG